MVSPQRKREILGLILMVLSLLLSMAILTYAAGDEPLARRFSFDSLWVPGNVQPANALGLTGVVLARLLVPGFLGYCILLLPLATFAWGYVWLRNRSTEFLRQVTVLFFIAALLLASMFGWFSIYLDKNLIVWSGAWGVGLAGWMGQIFGTWGSLILLLLAQIVTVLLLVDHDVQRSIDRIEGIVGRTKSNVVSWWKKRSENRAKQKISPDLQESSGQHERQRRLQQEKESQNQPPQHSRETISEDAIPDWSTSSPLDSSDGNGSARGMNDTGNPVPEVTPLPLDPNLELSVQEQIHEELSTGDLHVGASQSKSYDFEMPQLDLLDRSVDGEHEIDYEELEEHKQILLDKLGTYNIEITSINAIVGPTVTLYELTPAPGIKISRITALENDLAMAMAARGIRMIAPIPGKTAIGVEIPNRHRELVRITDVIGTAKFAKSNMELPLILGKSIEGEIVLEDLTKMPHVLIAGATGSGKSVGLNTFIAGLLFACRPELLKFVMIDPKKIELSPYAHIASHYIAMPPEADHAIITDVDQALGTLKSCEKEMELRYDLLSKAHVRSLKEYNHNIKRGILTQEDGHVTLPYIVIVVDELADLMMTAGKDIEAPIARLAQMARAVGIHLILATQRPSVDVITGLIKANFPSRIAYQVASKIDSRTILDQNGAEGLVGNGDLLYMLGTRVVRLQGPFVSIDEVDRITQFIGKQHGEGPYMLPSLDIQMSVGSSGNVHPESRDDFFKEAAQIIVRSQQGSVSLLQRKLSVGYARAARLIDQLEDAGIVGPFEGSKARQVLVTDETQLNALLAG